MSWDDFPTWFRRRRRSPFDNWFFPNMDDMMKEMEKMMEEFFKEYEERIPNEIRRERKLTDGRVIREIGPVVYGYSITIGPDGKPVIREFGNLKSSPQAGRGGMTPSIDVKAEREPLVDVISDNGRIRVVAELPGVEKSDINLNATESTLTISVNTKTRKYLKELDLPTPVNPRSAKSYYKNGVLEVILEKVKEQKPKGERINVE